MSKPFGLYVHIIKYMNYNEDKISIFMRDRFADYDVWFYGAGGFRLSLHLYHRGLHTCTAVARNPCVNNAFLLNN